MPLSDQDLDDVLLELQRQMRAAGFSEIDAAIVRIESERTFEMERRPSRLSARERLAFYLDQLTETVGGATEDSLRSTIATIKDNVGLEGRLTVQVVLEPPFRQAVGADVFNIDQVVTPAELVTELRAVILEVLEA